MRREGVTVSKEKIIESVWPEDSDILQNTVEAFVGMIRSKLKQHGVTSPQIKTVRGFGYKLEVES